MAVYNLCPVCNKEHGNVSRCTNCDFDLTEYAFASLRQQKAMVEAHRASQLSAVPAPVEIISTPVTDNTTPSPTTQSSLPSDNVVADVYRAILQMAWMDHYLERQEINFLFQKTQELQLTLEQTEAIEREVIGRSVREQAYFTALQAAQNESGVFSLQELQKLPEFTQYLAIPYQQALAVELEVLGKPLLEALIFELQQQKAAIPMLQNNQLIQPVVTNCSLINNRYQDLSDGTVLDTQTNLQWMRCALGQTWNGQNCVGKADQFNWEEAKIAAQQTQYADKINWRLPTIDELKTLIIVENKPMIDQQAFPNMPISWCWSDSWDTDNSSYAWGVNFYSGDLNNNYRTGNSHVRLVRCGK